MNIKDILRSPDLMVAVGVIAVVAMLIIPIPAILLDTLQSISLGIGILILLTVMYVRKSSDFNVFPSLLLVTTVFRLALNVSSTRLILLKGTSFNGKLIRAFGSFVVGNNYIIGFIIFLILVIVQFIVITKGAERIAEVAARFSLDGMPSRMFTIDQEVNSGAITEEEGAQKREALRQESDFYGSMDGASKFVKGDVIVGIIITLINIFGGFIIGMVIRGEPFNVALKTYTILTIGDGLVSQLPSLLITTATGILVSRAISKSTLGNDLAKQLLQFPKILWISAATLFSAMFIPGFPKLPLFFLSVFFAFMAYKIGASKEEAFRQERIEKQKARDKKSPTDVRSLIKVEPILIEFGYKIIPYIDPNQGGKLVDKISGLRREFAKELGMIIQPIRLMDNIVDLSPTEYRISINGSEVATGEIEPNKVMALDTGKVIERIEGDEFEEPAFGRKAVWIHENDKYEAEKKGYEVIEPATIITTHLQVIIKEKAPELLTREIVNKLIDNIKEDYPIVVKEVTEKLKIGQIQHILQLLVSEDVSIRNLPLIFETLADYADKVSNTYVLSEYVRLSLRRQIVNNTIDKTKKKLFVITAEPSTEQLISRSVRESEFGPIAALSPDNHEKIIGKVSDVVSNVMQRGINPVIATAPSIRKVFRDLIVRYMKIPVLSYREITDDVPVEEVGTISIGG